MQPDRLAQLPLQRSTGVLEGVLGNFWGTCTNVKPSLSSHVANESAETVTMHLKDISAAITVSTNGNPRLMRDSFRFTSQQMLCSLANLLVLFKACI